MQANIAKEVAVLRTLSSDVKEAMAGMTAAMANTPRVLEETRGAVRQVAADTEQLHKAVAGAQYMGGTYLPQKYDCPAQNHIQERRKTPTHVVNAAPHHKAVAKQSNFSSCA